MKECRLTSCIFNLFQINAFSEILFFQLPFTCGCITPLHFIPRLLRVACEPFADSVDHDQTAQNVQSDLDLHWPIRACPHDPTKNNFEIGKFGFFTIRLNVSFKFGQAKKLN